MSQTFTTARGECPVIGSMGCENACELINLCATIEKGKCLFENTTQFVDANGSPSVGLDVQRDLVLFNFRIQNCTGSDIKLNSVELHLEHRLLLLDPTYTPNTESEVDLYVPESEGQTNLVELNIPLAKTLLLSATCGSANTHFTGGITAWNASTDVSIFGASDEKLLSGVTVVAPGECCIKYVLAVDQAVNDVSTPTSFKDFVLERACISVKGTYNKGSSCCKFSKNLILPADCALRLERDSTPCSAGDGSSSIDCAYFYRSP